MTAGRDRESEGDGEGTERGDKEWSGEQGLRVGDRGKGKVSERIMGRGVK